MHPSYGASDVIVAYAIVAVFLPSYCTLKVQLGYGASNHLRLAMLVGLACSFWLIGLSMLIYSFFATSIGDIIPTATAILQPVSVLWVCCIELFEIYSIWFARRLLGRTPIPPRHARTMTFWTCLAIQCIIGGCSCWLLASRQGQVLWAISLACQLSFSIMAALYVLKSASELSSMLPSLIEAIAAAFTMLLSLRSTGESFETTMLCMGGIVIVVTTLFTGQPQISDLLCIRAFQVPYHISPFEKCTASSDLGFIQTRDGDLPPNVESRATVADDYIATKRQVEKTIYRIPSDLLQKATDNETWTRIFVCRRDFEDIRMTFQLIPHIHDVGITPDEEYYEIAISQTGCFWLLRIDFPILLASESGLQYDVSEPSQFEINQYGDLGARKIARQRFILHMVEAFLNPAFGEELFQYYRHYYGDSIVHQAFYQCKILRNDSICIQKSFARIRGSIPLDLPAGNPLSGLVNSISGKRLQEMRLKIVQAYCSARHLQQNHENDMLLFLCYCAGPFTIDDTICEWAVSPIGTTFYSTALEGFRGGETMEQTSVRLLGLLSLQTLLHYHIPQTSECSSGSYLEDFDRHVSGRQLKNGRAVLQNMAFCLKRQIHDEECSPSIWNLFEALQEHPLSQFDEMSAEYWGPKSREQLSHEDAWTIAMLSISEKWGIRIDAGQPWQESSNNEAIITEKGTRTKSLDDLV